MNKQDIESRLMRLLDEDPEAASEIADRVLRAVYYREVRAIAQDTEPVNESETEIL